VEYHNIQTPLLNHIQELFEDLLLEDNAIYVYNIQTVMSQSDYIRYKRVANELRNQAKNLAPVIESGQYIHYKSFTLENTIVSNKTTYTKLQPSSSVNVFGMQKTYPSGCSSFQLCRGTDSRVNRKPLLGTQSAAQPLPVIKTNTTPDKLNVCKYC
jgi:hypothetical protein